MANESFVSTLDIVAKTSNLHSTQVYVMSMTNQLDFSYFKIKAAFNPF